MKIDRKLNLVLKIEREDGSELHAHSVPIALSIFERYFLVMSQAWTAIVFGGVGNITGARVAAMMLKDVAQKEGKWEGDEGVERGLLGEIRRLTNVSVPAPGGGWQVMPLDLVITQDMIDEEDASELMNAVVFFTLASSVPRRTERKVHLDMIALFWGGQLVSSNATEYTSSLKTSTMAAASGEKPIVSSIPT